jgi:hypothetical protein
MPSFIYGLVDPRTSEVRYVGKTAGCPHGRWKIHMRDKMDLYKVRWINTLKTIGLQPDLLIIEYGDWSRDELNARECWWIEHGRRWGWDLTNGTRGGDGLVDPSPETLAKMSASRRARPVASTETRERIAAAHRGTWHSQTWNESVRAGLNTYYNTNPDARRLKSERMTLWWAERRRQKLEAARA